MIGSSDIYVAPVVDCMSHGLELPRLSRMGLRAELIDGRGGRSILTLLKIAFHLDTAISSNISAPRSLNLTSIFA